MNFGIMTSFIVGGLLLLSVMTLNARVMQNSGETTLNLLARQHVTQVNDMIHADFRRMAFDVPQAVDAILVAEDHRLKFRGDLYDGDGSGYNTIEWIYDTSADVSSTTNPDDHVLTRIVDGSSTTLPTVTTTFKFTYYNGSGTQLSTPVSAGQLDTIRKIKVEVVCESAETYEQLYQKSYWLKTFMPTNLQMRS